MCYDSDNAPCGCLMPLKRAPTSKRDTSADLVQRRLPQCKVHGCSRDTGAQQLVSALPRACFDGIIIIQWPVQQEAQRNVSRKAASRVSHKCRKRSCQSAPATGGVLKCRTNSNIPRKHVGDQNTSTTCGKGGQFAKGYLGKVDAVLCTQQCAQGLEVNGSDHNRALTQVQDLQKERGAAVAGLRVSALRADLTDSQLDAVASDLVARLCRCAP